MASWIDNFLSDLYRAPKLATYVSYMYSSLLLPPTKKNSIPVLIETILNT